MTNAELIRAVRYCVQSRNCDGCDLLISHNGVLTCKSHGKKALLLAAADALEDDEARITVWERTHELAVKRIRELEAQLPKQDRGVCMTAIGTLYVPNYDDER